MKQKYAMDVSNLRHENVRQMEELEERFQNMAEASFQQQEYEHSQQMAWLERSLKRKEREQQEYNTRLIAKLQRKQEEISLPRERHEAARYRETKGGEALCMRQ